MPLRFDESKKVFTISVRELADDDGIHRIGFERGGERVDGGGVAPLTQMGPTGASKDRIAHFPFKSREKPRPGRIILCRRRMRT